MPLTSPEICPLGISGLLVRFARDLSDEANAHALAFRDQVSAAALPGVTDVIPALVSVHVTFDPDQTTRERVTKDLQQLLSRNTGAVMAPRRQWRIPVAFGPDHAPQLAEAAQLAGITPDQAVADILTAKLRVIAIGFAPGQPYLGMLPGHWDMPRQPTLTPQMPRGALVVAVRQLIIFAADAPTGWRHIGQTAFRVYQPDAPEPFAFAPGDLVTFSQIADDVLDGLKNRTDTNGGAICEVLR